MSNHNGMIWPVEYSSDFTILRRDGALDVYCGPIRDTQLEAEGDVLVLSMLQNFTGKWTVLRLQHGTKDTVVKEGWAAPTRMPV